MYNEMYYILQIGPRGQGGVNTMIESIVNSKLSQEYCFVRVNTVTQKSRVISYLQAFLQCVRYKNNVSIAHIHMASNGSFARKSGIIGYFHKNRIPIVLHLHGAKFREFYKESAKRKQDKIRAAFQKADRVIVLADDWIPFAEEMGVSDRTFIVPNFTKIPETIERKNNEAARFLFLGRLGKRKGVYDLVDAVEYMVHKYGECRFSVILAGDGEVQETTQYINSKGLEGYFCLTGWVDGEKKEELLRGADVLVVPSYFESFGLSFIEAMSYGLPVIGTTSGSIPQVVDDGRDGFLIEAGNIAQLAERMKWLMDHPETAHVMGKCGRTHVIKEYSEEVFCKKMRDIYSKFGRPVGG